MTLSRAQIADRLDREEMRRADQRIRRIENRMRYLPHAIYSTREKLAALEQEARSYGMVHLLGEQG